MYYCVYISFFISEYYKWEVTSRRGLVCLSGPVSDQLLRTYKGLFPNKLDYCLGETFRDYREDRTLFLGSQRW